MSIMSYDVFVPQLFPVFPADSDMDPDRSVLRSAKNPSRALLVFGRPVQDGRRKSTKEAYFV